jgi:acetyl esterase/lipase
VTSTSRRAVLGGGLAAGVVGLAGCGGSPREEPRGARRVRYGADPSQHADLRRPARGVRDRGLTVALLHGGYWLSAYGADLMEPLARRLAGLGVTTWNLEYRRVGSGGGWPATFEDVAAGLDALADQDVPRTTVLLGHSAGGHLAGWAASRTAQTPGGAARVPLVRVLSLAGVLDLTAAAAQSPSAGPVAALMGGTPDQQPERYRQGDPTLLVPASCPVIAVRATDDRVVDPAQSPAYVAAAREAGGEATLVEVPGDHFAMIDPGSTAGRQVVRLALDGDTRSVPKPG